MPINSMTAFGTGETKGSEYHYRCEMKTLNSRFLDVNVRLPRSLSMLERDIVNACKAVFKRGKADISFDVAAVSAAERLPRLNPEAFAHYRQINDKLRQLLPEDSKSLSIYEYLRLEGVLETHASESNDAIIKLHRDGVMASLKLALDSTQKARELEGEALAAALRSLVGDIARERAIISQQSKQLQEQLYGQYRKRLETLIANLGEAGHTVTKQLPEDRLLTEVAILTDKTDIDEELTRLATHEGEFLNTLDQGGEVGRKLDFLCQEMHREVNTMANKLTHSHVNQHSLAIKQAVERIRQQVQNIE